MRCDRSTPAPPLPRCCTARTHTQASTYEQGSTPSRFPPRGTYSSGSDGADPGTPAASESPAHVEDAEALHSESHAC
jgi:hypothetical protein